MSEGVLFADPYRSLDAIAGPTSPNVLAIMERDAANGAPANDGLADPFRSAARQAAPESEANEPSKPSAIEAAPSPQAQSAGPPPPALIVVASTPLAASDNEAKLALAAAELKQLRSPPIACKRNWSCRSLRRAWRGWVRPSTSRRPKKVC